MQLVPHWPDAVTHLYAVHVVPVADVWQLFAPVHVCVSVCVRSVEQTLFPHDVATA